MGNQKFHIKATYPSESKSAFLFRPRPWAICGPCMRFGETSPLGEPFNLKAVETDLRRAQLVNILMAEQGRPDTQLFDLLTTLLQQVESLSNQEEVELRAKIQALGLEVTKVPKKSSKHLEEWEIAAELDKLSAKLDDVDKMVSSAMAADPQVQSLLSGTSDLWMPVITANADERRAFTPPANDSNNDANQSHKEMNSDAEQSPSHSKFKDEITNSKPL